MKRFIAVLLAAVCLLISGCGSWMDGSYVSITPHMSQKDDDGQDVEWISNGEQLYEAIRYMVNRGTSDDVFFIRDYSENAVSVDMVQARYKIMNSDPIGAYAVLDIQYEMGINGGQSTLAVSIEYSHQRSEILRIQKVWGTELARNAIVSALSQMDTELVFYVENYQATDFAQIVEDYAQENPDVVIEIPQVSVSVYPDKGESRVVELNFTYQTNRDSLRNMQSQVKRIFESAELYVSGDESTYETLSHLYVFLVERNDYQTETSITPAYSLLRHGVGDSRAFAMVFAAMCRQVGLECLTVSGTRDGESWFWNIVKDDGVYCHVDILRCAEIGEFFERSDAEMVGYVWDYSAYPACDREAPLPAEDPEETEPGSLEETVDPPEITEQITEPVSQPAAAEENGGE